MSNKFRPAPGAAGRVVAEPVRDLAVATLRTGPGKPALLVGVRINGTMYEFHPDMASKLIDEIKIKLLGIEG